MTTLSILIPARNELFLSKTIESILENIESETEVIAVLDGVFADPPVPNDPRVTIIYHQESIGQRAATNEAAKLSTGKYIMKVDAHCSFDKGFDTKMLAVMQDNWTMVPLMKNLHAFDWVCKKCGNRRYQGKSGIDTKTRGLMVDQKGKCPKCSGEEYIDIIWKGKKSPNSTSYCFDSEPHFQYFREFSKRPEGKGDITPTMSLQGSCFMLTREKYWELEICDEAFGSWGSQGIEVALRTWLSGGQVMVNQKTWYAHMFRTQGGNFGFPYHIAGSQVRHAKRTARDMFWDGKWDKQIYPVSSLVEKFWPIRKDDPKGKGWTDEDLKKLKKRERDSGVNLTARFERFASVPGLSDNTSSSKLTKGIVYYTDNRLDPDIMRACQTQLKKNGLPIVSVSLEPLDFGKNIVLNEERGYLTMFKQILVGLEELDTDIVFFSEHDDLYAVNHFDFTPQKKDVFYYNNNLWKVRTDTGEALHHISNHTSQLCAYRSLLLEHYRERVKRTEQKLHELGDTKEYRRWIRKQGFEPGTHNRKERVDDYKHEIWMSKIPNIDIRHGKNLTQTRWKKEQFRNQRFTEGWKEADKVPGWGVTKGRFMELLNERS